MTRPVKNLSGSIATGDSTHFGTNDLDQVNNYLTGQDQSASDPVTLATATTLRDLRLKLRNPANTNTLTFKNPTITADSNFQFNEPFDYFIFIDPDDSNKIKAKNGRTNAIDFSDPSSADTVFQQVCNALNSGSVIGTAGTPIPGAGDLSHLWSGGKYGTIGIGPGTFVFSQAVKYGSNVKFIGSGCTQTIIQLADNLYPTTNNNTLDLFKSNSWDTLSIGGGTLTTEQLGRGEQMVMFTDLQLYGNFRNNQLPDASTATTTGLGTVASPETAGTDSWGHGIAHYGSLLFVNNLWVHSCPGAGIIIQNNGTGLGGGWPYPINSFTNFGGGQGKGFFSPLCYVTNVQSIANGRQGLLLRGATYVSNYWSYHNGEAGIDVQVCDYFNGGPSYIRGIEVFEDGWHHGAQASPQTTTYDPLGFEMRMLGGCWLSDAWVEVPMGNGDNLMLGSNGGPSSPSGYQIKTSAGNHVIVNTVLDYVRANGIFIGQNANNVLIKNTSVFTVWQPNTTYTLTAPMTCLGGSNDIEIQYRGFNSGTGHTNVDGVIIGSSSPSIAPWNNKFTLFSINNDIAINNQNTGNRYDMTMTFVDSTASTKYFNNTAGVNPDLANCSIVTNQMGHWASSSVGTRSRNGGIVTLTGNGSTTVFNIAHFLFTTPAFANVRASNAAAAALAIPAVTVDATNVIVTFASAPASGSYIYWWEARVTP